MPEKDLRNSNMYSYCRNMVTCGIDPDGTKWWQAVLNWTAEKIVEPIVNGVESLIGDVDMTITLGFSITASIGFGLIVRQSASQWILKAMSGYMDQLLQV